MRENFGFNTLVDRPLKNFANNKRKEKRRKKCEKEKKMKERKKDK